MSLTDEQSAVVAHRAGVAVVEADPGSGKTHTIAARTIALPAFDSTLNLAFNKKAAEEMEKRTKGIGENRTYHSKFMRLIMANPTHFGFATKPKVESGGYFSLLKASTGLDVYSWDESPWDPELVGFCERSMFDGDLEEALETDGTFAETYSAVMKMRAWMLRKGVLPFDTMGRLVAEKLALYGNDPLCPPGCDHLQVDEFQDTDKFQWTAVHAWATRVESLVIVGDPKQRIYGWRGALEDGFESMLVATAGVKMRLSTNFRSREGIIRMAEGIFPVGMKGIRPDVPTPMTVEWESDHLNPKILDPSGPKWSERAILCRYNRECVQWQLALAKRNIPVMLVGRADFWAEKHVVMAVKARENGDTARMVMEGEEWRRFTKRKRFVDAPEELERVKNDFIWLTDMSKEDFNLLRQVLQHEDGVRVSTIHKSKGAEWEWVMVHGVTPKLQEEKEVWYVAVTRAKDRLILAGA
jgi:superfamily I DNA/RNA helicase